MPATRRSFTFNGQRYIVDYAAAIYGMTDRLEEPGESDLHMTLLGGNSYQAFHSALHEALEASGFPDAALHDANGEPTTYDAARFLWSTWIKRTGAEE